MYFKKENGQMVRVPLDGPNKVICFLVDKSGRVLTQAEGLKHKKFSAEYIARIKALMKLKKKLGRRWIENKKGREFDIKYRSVE